MGLTEDDIAAKKAKMQVRLVQSFDYLLQKEVQDIAEKERLMNKIEARKDREKVRQEREKAELEEKSRLDAIKQAKSAERAAKARGHLEELTRNAWNEREEKRARSRENWLERKTQEERARADERRQREMEKKAYIQELKEQSAVDTEERRQRQFEKYQNKEYRYQEEQRMRQAKAKETRALEEKFARAEANRKADADATEDANRRLLEYWQAKEEALRNRQERQQQVKAELKEIRSELGNQQQALTELMTKAQFTGNFEDVRTEVNKIQANMQSTLAREQERPVPQQVLQKPKKAVPGVTPRSTSTPPKFKQKVTRDAEVLAKELMRVLDSVHRSGQVSLNELDVALTTGYSSKLVKNDGTRKLLNEFIPWLRNDFRGQDSNHDGSLSLEEMEQAVMEYTRDVQLNLKSVSLWQRTTLEKIRAAEAEGKSEEEPVQEDVKPSKSLMKFQSVVDKLKATVTVPKEEPKRKQQETASVAVIADKFQKNELNQRAQHLIQLLEMSGRARQNLGLVRSLLSLARELQGTIKSITTSPGKTERGVQREPLLAAAVPGSIVHVELIETAQAMQNALLKANMKPGQAGKVQSILKDLDTLITQEQAHERGEDPSSSPRDGTQADARSGGAADFRAPEMKDLIEAVADKDVKRAAKLVQRALQRGTFKSVIDYLAAQDSKINASELHAKVKALELQDLAVIQKFVHHNLNFDSIARGEGSTLSDAPTVPDPLNPGLAAERLAALSIAAVGLPDFIPGDFSGSGGNTILRARLRPPGRACTGSAKLAQMRTGSRRWVLVDERKLNSRREEAADHTSTMTRSASFPGKAAIGMEGTRLDMDNTTDMHQSKNKGVSFES